MSSGSGRPEVGFDAGAWRRRTRRGLLGLLAGLVAVLLRAAVQPVLGDELPFVVALPTTAFAALMWGFGPGVLAAAVCVAGVVLPVVPPDVSGVRAAFLVGGFSVAALLLCVIIGARNARFRRQAALLPADGGQTSVASWLRAVLIGAFAVPITAFVAIAWWGYERALADAHGAAAQASALALRHAERTFAVAADIAHKAGDATAGPDDTVRAAEAQLHRRLGDMVLGATSVVNMNVWDANGRPLVRSDDFPADSRASVADRAYFTEQRAPNAPVGVSGVLIGRQTGLPLLNVVTRRPSADGSFRGVVAVSLSPDYFNDHYRSMAADEPRLASFALVRLDGELLARYPATPDGRNTARADSPTLARVRAGETVGSVVLPATENRESRVVSFRRVPGYPVYVVAGFSHAAMLSGWTRFLAILAAVMLPIAGGLFYVTRVALHKTLREQATAAELSEQIRRRAVAERSMLESQKLETLSVLTGGVAHDFNNVLAIVHTNLHVQRAKHPTQADEPQLKAMARAVNTGARLTRQLLSFSRRQALKPERIDLQHWLPAMAELLHTTLGKNIETEFVVAPDTSTILVDAAELELALINLALNARHAMPGGGRFSVSARPVEPEPQDGTARVVICAQDNGVGIAEHILPRVVEPFFTTRERGVGSGLGLSQVHGFCSQAGGSLRIDSQLGQGTTVCLYLPAVDGDAGAVATTELQSHDAEPLRGRLLLVEDNVDVAGALQSLLLSAGLEVQLARSAAEALALIEGSGAQPDVVLSDIAMPGQMDGIALAFRLRQLRPALPVLLTTGYADRLGDAIGGGFEVLPKPTPPEQLLRRLREALQQRVPLGDTAIG